MLQNRRMQVAYKFVTETFLTFSLKKKKNSQDLYCDE